MVDLIEPSEILVDPIELMELCPVERPKVDLNDSTLSYLAPFKFFYVKNSYYMVHNLRPSIKLIGKN